MTQQRFTRGGRRTALVVQGKVLVEGKGAGVLMDSKAHRALLLRVSEGGSFCLN